MDLSRYRDMDGNLLYSILNMKLRNVYRDLDDLCRSHDIKRDSLDQVMVGHGYSYNEAQHQFRPVSPSS